MQLFNVVSNRKNRKPVTAAIALVAAATLLLAGCTSENAPVAADLQQGGTLVIGAEQEPDCMDWIASCGGSIWGSYMAQITTTPFVFNVRKVGDDSEVLCEAGSNFVPHQ